MSRIYISLILALFAASSCNYKGKANIPPSFKDSVIKDYLATLDSSISFDTSEINYKVLKAYINNDTFSLKKLSFDVKQSSKAEKHWLDMDSCLHQPELRDLDVEEAYRFIHLVAFCPYKLNITISRKADIVNLHFIIYQSRWDTSICHIVNEYDKKLTIKNWGEFQEAIAYSDFWGLKQENGVHGLDGSSLITMGYVKGSVEFNRPSKYSYVYRWGPTTLSGSLNLLLKWSGNKQGCIWVE